MIDALMSAVEAETGIEAGEILAHGGWAVFPVPLGRKFDSGAGAMTYRDASTDPARWEWTTRRVMDRHGCTDVNIAVSPWRCDVPLVGIDLDGPQAVAVFRAQHQGDYFRIESSGKGGGMHVYVAGTASPVGGTNPWGGEYRSAVGHLMLPPSLIDGRRDYYRPLGGGFLSGIDLPGRPVEGGGAASLDMVRTIRAVERLSTFPANQSKVDQFRARVERLSSARDGERHPVMVSAVASAVALARRRQIPLRPALDIVADAFPRPDRDIDAEVMSVATWALAQEVAK